MLSETGLLLALVMGILRVVGLNQGDKRLLHAGIGHVWRNRLLL
ncbi:MAG: hypothetical protein ACR5LC_11675 [Symbiopectobacterium sp.]